MPLPTNRGLNTLERLILYSLHGPCVEVCFTALWDLVAHRNLRLHGLTSVWAFPIYGLSLLVIEKMSLALKDKLPWPIRALIYLIWSYAWEFSFGFVLRQFDACPWDYEPWFDGHFMGLITAEYAPMWYLANALAEHFVIRAALSIRWGEGSEKID